MNAKKVVFGILGAVGLVLAGAGGYAYYFYNNQPNAEFWNSSIEAFEEQDRVAPPSPGQVLFVGSSSIRFWDTLAQDMAPIGVLNRGFGGSNLPHIAHFFPRVILPYSPRAIVLYAGDNDFGGPSPKTPEQVFAAFKALDALLKAQLPDTPLYFLSIKPSILRWEKWPEMHAANRLIEAYTQEDERLHYIDVSTPLLSENSEPREDLFVFDGLHLNADGYAVWTAAVRPILLQDLGE